MNFVFYCLEQNETQNKLLIPYFTPAVGRIGKFKLYNLLYIPDNYQISVSDEFISLLFRSFAEEYNPV